MATRHWKVEITRLGTAETLFGGIVESPTWPAALQVVRAGLGETGGVPAGASCRVNPDGTVIVQDARGLRRYQIVPADKPAPPPGTKRQAPGPPEAKTLLPPMPTPLQPRSAAVRPRSEPPPVPANHRPGRAPRSSSPPPASVEKKLILVSSREEKPRESSPIHFRERMYAVPVPFDPGTGEKLAASLLRRVQDEIRDIRGPKFVRIELFDHVWKQKPHHPPVVRLEWKDWAKTIDIEFPLSEEARQSAAPQVSSVPPPPTEDRLAAAFEACHDLLFLKNRAEALEFAVHLLEELVPSEANAAFLLDVNTDELRVVAARGTGARERKGRAYPSSGGLLGAAGNLGEHAVLVLADAPADPRYDDTIDGIPGMDVRALLYRPLIHGGRLFGVLQLANGVTGGMFREADCEVVDYITQQLSAFVARGPSIERPATASR